jgi:hypothetical protein
MNNCILKGPTMFVKVKDFNYDRSPFIYVRYLDGLVLLNAKTLEFKMIHN